jgi:hypothetical protein
MYLSYTNSKQVTVKLFINPKGVVNHFVSGDFIYLTMKPVDVQTKLKDFTWGLTLAIESIHNYQELTEFLKNVNAGVFIPEIRTKTPSGPKKATSAKITKIKPTDQGSLEF